MTDEEKRFHLQRRMFYISPNHKVVIAPLSAKTHELWMRETDDDWKTVVRGYIDSTGIYFYRGSGFDTDEGVEAAALTHAPTIAKLFKRSEMPVFAGVIPGEVGARWTAIKNLGHTPTLER